jgi:hypothetical protein
MSSGDLQVHFHRAGKQAMLLDVHLAITVIVV